MPPDGVISGVVHLLLSKMRHELHRQTPLASSPERDARLRLPSSPLSSRNPRAFALISAARNPNRTHPQSKNPAAVRRMTSRSKHFRTSTIVLPRHLFDCYGLVGTGHGMRENLLHDHMELEPAQHFMCT